MPAKTKTRVEGIQDVKKRLKDVKRNSYRKSTIVSAAKKSGDPMVREMKKNLASVPVDRSRALVKLIGKKRISRKYDGDNFPGAFIGLKDKNKFTQPASGGALNIYWIEFGTDQRKTKSGRETGKMQAHAPLRKAIKATVRPANRSFVNKLIEAVNDRINKNRL